MGWGLHDVAVSMGLSGGNASLSRSLERQLGVPGAQGAVTRVGVTGNGEAGKPTEGGVVSSS